MTTSLDTKYRALIQAKLAAKFKVTGTFTGPGTPDISNNTVVPADPIPAACSPAINPTGELKDRSGVKRSDFFVYVAGKEATEKSLILAIGTEVTVSGKTGKVVGLEEPTGGDDTWVWELHCR